MDVLYSSGFSSIQIRVSCEYFFGALSICQVLDKKSLSKKTLGAINLLTST